MGNKVLGAIGLTCRLFCGITAGYFVHKAIEDKADQLVAESDSVLNAFAIGAGQAAVSSGAGLIAFYLAG